MRLEMGVNLEGRKAGNAAAKRGGELSLWSPMATVLGTPLPGLVALLGAGPVADADRLISDGPPGLRSVSGTVERRA